MTLKDMYGMVTTEKKHVNAPQGTGAESICFKTDLLSSYDVEVIEETRRMKPLICS